MDLKTAMERRHAVRQYRGLPIPPETAAELEREIAACNAEGGLHIQLALEEPEAFRGPLAHYGSFRNVRDYLCLAGPQGPELEEKIGYYGQRLVLRAFQLGLDSCWTALTFRKRKCRCDLRPGEKLVCAVALGYGKDHGVPHKSKALEAVCRWPGDAPPDWFRAGAEAALLAPTALGQQKFLLTLEGDRVRAEALKGPYSQIDLGIVKYQFELAAGRKPWI
ncbi:nitroreductase family protein [uncultured Oscillibacter sp.]|uniref:nitroreductase family protein n=1 Tax=uncultured Oscillibacter sp. TaxID=876091 RepID=UPI0025E98330|nr:nitroreductase family protein [uncultured Oscillibacter sp.]